MLVYLIWYSLKTGRKQKLSSLEKYEILYVHIRRENPQGKAENKSAYYLQMIRQAREKKHREEEKVAFLSELIISY